MVKLAKKGNTGVLQYEGRLIVTYHHTTIVECGHNGIILNSGGWYTHHKAKDESGKRGA